MKKNYGSRPSPIAGKWYPADPHRLADQVDRYIQDAKPPPVKGEVVGVMVPHAGHLYSGPVAGYAFATLKGLRPEIVIIISPMHYAYQAPLITTAHSSYKTPLGEIQVDMELLDALDELLFQKLGYRMERLVEDEEHSLEIELPFLQRVIPGEFRLLPVMVRDPSHHVIQVLGEALAKIINGKSAVFVASTDLSHFYPEQVAKQLDREVLRNVESLDPEGVLTVEEEGRGFACGRGALAAVLWAVKELGVDHAQVLRHATSGDVTGDYSRVVGYASAVFTRPKKDMVN